MTEFTPRAEDQVGLDNSAPVQTNRKWIIDLIRDEFDPAPSYFKKGDEWNDRAETIADAILARLNPNA